jgi:protein TonB
VAPIVIHRADPKYTSDAMRAKLQGDVTLDVVVLPDGSVGRARVTKSLDTQFGLDAMAVDAAKRWLFQSGQLYGQPVPVLMSIAVEFRLH